MHITIPKPCNENWNEMTPEQQGAFCKVCSKVVVDFSNMSDEEVINYFEKKKGEKTCGRFRPSQLAPYELKVDVRAVAIQHSFPKTFAILLFLFFSSLFICRSDTGDPMNFKVSAINLPDTASLPSLVSKISDTVVNAPSMPLLTECRTMGEPAFPLQPVTEITEPVAAADTAMTPIAEEADTTQIVTVQPVVIDRPQIMGIINYRPSQTEVLGKVKCQRPTREENKRIKKQKERQRRVEKETRIMGDLEF